MDHVHCRELLESLSDYVDGVLEQAVCAEIERHMQGCENCRIVIDSLRKTVYLYQVAAQQSPEVPEDVRQRLYHCLDLDAFLEKTGPAE